MDVLADLFAQKTDLVLQVLELELGLVIFPRLGLKLGDLFFDALQLALRFEGWFHK
jgi:hypothetical protein